jgi:hypothetical protein
VRDTWGAPAGGWPSFGPDGKRVQEGNDEPEDPPPPERLDWTRPPDD